MCFLLDSQFPDSSNIKVLGAKINPPEPETFTWNYTQNIKSYNRKEKQVNITTIFCFSQNMCSEREIPRGSQIESASPVFCYSPSDYPCLCANGSKC